MRMAEAGARPVARARAPAGAHANRVRGRTTWRASHTPGSAQPSRRAPRRQRGRWRRHRSLCRRGPVAVGRSPWTVWTVRYRLASALTLTGSSVRVSPCAPTAPFSAVPSALGRSGRGSQEPGFQAHNSPGRVSSLARCPRHGHGRRYGRSSAGRDCRRPGPSLDVVLGGAVAALDLADQQRGFPVRPRSTSLVG